MQKRNFVIKVPLLNVYLHITGTVFQFRQKRAELFLILLDRQKNSRRIRVIAYPAAAPDCCRKYVEKRDLITAFPGNYMKQEERNIG
ncbi:hypothetical protein PSAB_16395 [Paenibacillus sabinae T27]|uniref:Uncharacterized protein n=1 Tax=Paenibacillus sabinae T27 TaxID=1268072 RepID=X4ZF69_9BACL|nr:hypothetical protein PSAB_16395 [Paenibacillus sabinae T27]